MNTNRDAQSHSQSAHTTFSLPDTIAMQPHAPILDFQCIMWLPSCACVTCRWQLGSMAHAQQAWRVRGVVASGAAACLSCVQRGAACRWRSIQEVEAVKSVLARIRYNSILGQIASATYVYLLNYVCAVLWVQNLCVSVFCGMPALAVLQVAGNTRLLSSFISSSGADWHCSQCASLLGISRRVKMLPDTIVCVGLLAV